MLDVFGDGSFERSLAEKHDPVEAFGFDGFSVTKLRQ
jgi:hypothetical protein